MTKHTGHIIAISSYPLRVSGVITTGRTETPIKPRLRGWIHLWSFLLFLLTGIALIAVAAATVPGPVTVATAVYVTTVLGLFGVSAVYHRITWRSVRARTRMRRLDHAMIFLLIAGTYTPIAVLALPRPTGTWVLTVVWCGALAGVVLKLAWPNAPRWIGVPLYIALGWVALFVLDGLYRHAGLDVVALLVGGGLLYTMGALFYATRWPDPWPKTFGYHEFFHAAVTAAALCHHAAIWTLLNA